ncbi:MAG: hypothetical protein V3T02_07830 [Alphaproteobacteria bacterium]
MMPDLLPSDISLFEGLSAQAMDRAFATKDRDAKKTAMQKSVQRLKVDPWRGCASARRLTKKNGNSQIGGCHFIIGLYMSRCRAFAPALA